MLSSILTHFVFTPIQGHEAKDPTAFYAQIEERIEQLTDEQAKLIMNPPKGLVTREQLIIDNLVEYLGR